MLRYALRRFWFVWGQAFAFLNFAWLQVSLCLLLFAWFAFLSHQIMSVFPGQYKCCNYISVLCKQREVMVSFSLT